MNPATRAQQVRVIEYDTVGSTNAEALALARAGEKGPLWIKARRQTAGRGRRGRGWVSEPGNLHASLLLTEPSAPERAAELSFVAALAVHDAVAGLAPQVAARLALKWPNDLLVAGRKFCGILAESEGLAVVIGIGINCAYHPEQTRHPATDLASAGAAIAVDLLFSHLSRRMIERIAQWDRGAGFEAIRTEWLARAAGIGEGMRVRSPDGEVSGIFETIDGCGRLILRLSDGRRAEITAGDVLAFAGGRDPTAAGG